MPPPNQPILDDQVLTSYLLGSLPAEQAERLDELSIADEEFVWRLAGVENDLVDAFVKSELTGEALQRFNSHYLSSSKRRAKVEFAAALRQFQQTKAGLAQGRIAAPKRSLQARFSWSMPAWNWGFAVVMLLLAGYLLIKESGLRRQLESARAGEATALQREQQLRNDLEQQRLPGDESHRPENPGGSQSTDPQIKMVSLLLLPPTRGPATVPTLTVRGGTDLAVLLLALESNDFPGYRVTLKDPGSGRVLWRSAELETTSAGDKKAVSAGFPASLLKQQHYIAEVAGVRNGRAETLAGYPFQVVLR